jgi:hypothetical protein
MMPDADRAPIVHGERNAERSAARQLVAHLRPTNRRGGEQRKRNGAGCDHSSKGQHVTVDDIRIDA